MDLNPLKQKLNLGLPSPEKHSSSYLSHPKVNIKCAKPLLFKNVRPTFETLEGEARIWDIADVQGYFQDTIFKCLFWWLLKVTDKSNEQLGELVTKP